MIVERESGDVPSDSLCVQSESLGTSPDSLRDDYERRYFVWEKESPD